MTVKEYLDTFNAENENPYDNTVLLKYVNIVEQNLDVIKDYRVQTYTRVKDEYQYDLPEGVSFEDVYGLRVNGIRYKKVDIREHKKLRTFWYEGDKLCIYPACTETDDIADPKIRLVYKYKPAKKLIANIATDELYVPERFQEIYDFFLMAKIAYSQKEYGEHANHMTSFNNAVALFEDWYENHRPLKPEEELTPQDDYYADNSGFDYE